MGGGCCPPMDLFRSEPMQLVQLIVPIESAYLTVSYLGDLGLLQLKDTNIVMDIQSRYGFCEGSISSLICFLSGGRSLRKARPATLSPESRLGGRIAGENVIPVEECRWEEDAEIRNVRARFRPTSLLDRDDVFPGIPTSPSTLRTHNRRPRFDEAPSATQKANKRRN
uniref:Uncharacterized protein n=1 Tax=Kalanchoe fedtschenkoi TaxID=63787 RepID=A0A7N0UJ83_KALFE